MARSALFGGNSIGQGFPPFIQFDGRSGEITVTAYLKDGASGLFSKVTSPVAFGTPAIFDFLRAECGWFSWNPRDESRLFPMPYDPAEAAKLLGSQPGPEYGVVCRLPVFLKGFGLCSWTAGGTIAQNAIAELRLRWMHTREAAEGLIPAVQLLPPKVIEVRSRNNERHMVPQFPQVGSVPRQLDRYGPPLLPPPAAALAAPVPQPKLMPPAAVAAPPANDETPPWDEQAAPSPVERAAPASAPHVAAVVPSRPAPTVAAQEAANDAVVEDAFDAMVPTAANLGRPNF
jgi:hypothetical protein